MADADVTIRLNESRKIFATVTVYRGSTVQITGGTVSLFTPTTDAPRTLATIQGGGTALNAAAFTGYDVAAAQKVRANYILAPATLGLGLGSYVLVFRLILATLDEDGNSDTPIREVVVDVTVESDTV